MKLALFVSFGVLSFIGTCPVRAELWLSPIVTIEAVDDSASEVGADNAQLVVRRNKGTHIALRVFYRISGSAVNGVDYERLSGSVVIPSGSLEATIDIIALNDEVREGIERLSVSLRSAPRYARPYRIGESSRALVAIEDDESIPPAFTISVWQLPERGSPPSLPVEPARIAIAAWIAPQRVQYVEFFEADRLIGVVLPPEPVDPRNRPTDPPRPPFLFFWTGVSAGTYSITAVATLTDGSSLVSGPATVSVRPAPSPPQ